MFIRQKYGINRVKRQTEKWREGEGRMQLISHTRANLSNE